MAGPGFLATSHVSASLFRLEVRYPNGLNVSACDRTRRQSFKAQVKLHGYFMNNTTKGLKKAYSFEVRKPFQTLSSATEVHSQPSTSTQNSVPPTSFLIDQKVDFRGELEQLYRGAQASICAAIEEIDGKGKFCTDSWHRPGGGGGISRVMQEGNVFEKAGINFSMVYGIMPPEAVRLSRDNPDAPKTNVPFFATGITAVLHPGNPYVPTLHFSYRYFETSRPEGEGPNLWWFGGGTDLSPSYLFDEDARHFHSTLKAVCDGEDTAFYPRFKAECDQFFCITHRSERRGIGGIIFDDLNDRPKHAILDFQRQLLDAVLPSYAPIVARRRDMAFTTEEEEWQQLRRGRYAEFNLTCDRGTRFGLTTGGRVESILMSLPLTARYEYDHVPAPGSREARLLDIARNPIDWV